ncbi:MAG: riboflavin synthase [Deltaproteobacteria bacterium]|nr:riboflavin synthase [Deltaproteobacteria bacterium]
MFTGIIEDLGRILSLNQNGSGQRFEIANSLPREGVALGDSVAVDGVCLTVTALAEGAFSADVSGETLKVSSLGRLRLGDQVHLERALTLSGRLGGHLVSGHVDGQGKIVERRQIDPSLELCIEAPPALLPYLVPKGSVAVNGVSLTLNQPERSRFRVMLVPQTLQGTRLGELRVGDLVNLEADILGKYVRHFVLGAEGAKGVDEAFLREHGFL